MKKVKVAMKREGRIMVNVAVEKRVHSLLKEIMRSLAAAAAAAEKATPLIWKCLLVLLTTARALKLIESGRFYKVLCLTLFVKSGTLVHALLMFLLAFLKNKEKVAEDEHIFPDRHTGVLQPVFSFMLRE